MRAIKLRTDQIIAEKVLESIYPELCEECQARIKPRIIRLAQQTSEGVAESIFT